MTGIISYGAYIPLWRLARDAIAEAWGSGSIGRASTKGCQARYILDLRWPPSGSCSSSPGQRVRLSLTQFLSGGKIYG